jgi:alpha-tubulin suppressor-like RCC1 family protein
MGRRHACVLGHDERVACWGENDAGQLGDGSFTAHAAPARVADLEDVVAITAGGDVTCALQREGRVLCWGDNRWGQLGDGTMRDAARPTLVAALPAPVAGVATGGGHTCAWSDDGRAWCWGRNDQGQLGVGVVPAAEGPNPVRFAGPR